MRERIVKDGWFWVGEVYGTWSMMFGLCEHTGWESVTDKCFTRWGVMRELKKWKKENCEEEFIL